MSLKITRCAATPIAVAVFFSESVDEDSAKNGTYEIRSPFNANPLPLTGATIACDQFKRRVVITLPTPELNRGDFLIIKVTNVQSVGTTIPISDNGTDNVAATHVNGDDIDDEEEVQEAIEDLAAYPILTEEVGYPPSPLSVPSAGTSAMVPSQASLGGVVEGTLRQLLGWKPKADDPKGFVGALNASFDCKMVEGHTECTWTPRSYAVQTDLSGGITGAQASLYSRTKDAVDKSLPLLDGLYSLDEEAKPEDIEALKSGVRTQLIALVTELGIPGGPRVQRVNQVFGLLLGNLLFPINPQPGNSLQTTDPDQFDPQKSILGNLRLELGLTLGGPGGDDLVNTVDDEQNVTNFRIICDYVTSLAQSWLNNLGFFMIPSPQGTQPFFGTVLVLLSRQLSVIAEKVNEVRFTLDSVFIGPSERQTLRIGFQDGSSMFLEDLLSWVESFASQEGPQLIQEGGKYAVGTSFLTTVSSLLTLVRGAETPQDPSVLPAGYFTPRVRRSLEDLTDKLQDLVTFVGNTRHQITPEPQTHLTQVGGGGSDRPRLRPLRSRLRRRP